MNVFPLDAEVLVLGGGCAGIAAAISAASSGANVLLLETSKVLGGNASRAFVHTFCGIFEGLDWEKELKYTNPGFAKELTEAVQRKKYAKATEVHGRVRVVPTFPLVLSDFFASACRHCDGLELLMNSQATRLTESKQGGFEFSIKGERGHTGNAKVVIDASGDAVSASLLGAKSEMPSASEAQTATLIFRVDGACESDLEGYKRLKLSSIITRDTLRGKLPQGCESILVRPAEKKGQAYISLNLPKPADGKYDPCDAVFLESYKKQALDWANALTNYLSDQVEGWEQCSISEAPDRIGVRESRSLIGEYQLTRDDILTGRQFEDQVARSSWPIELWQDHRGAKFEYPKSSAGIPLRALRSKNIRNLGMAGRCMSGTHVALGALRVLGTAMATGEAIGLAAACAVKNGKDLRDVSAKEVNDARKQVKYSSLSKL